MPTPVSPSPDTDTPTDSDSDAQTEVEILQSDRKFITIALSPYRSSVNDIDPSALHPWCTHPDAESVTVPPKERKSPPVPAYLPEGVSFDSELLLDGKHAGNVYTSSGGRGDHMRISVTYGTCLITGKAPELLEQVSVAGNWGVIAGNMKDMFETLTLYIETELGYVEIQRIDTENKGRVGKDEIIKIAESMPIFGGEAASANDPANKSTDSPTDADVLVSTLGFVRVGLNGKDAYDVYPPGVHDSCIPPGPGHAPPAAKKEIGSPPAPAYLPEGVSLDQESHAPGGAHVGNIYAATGGVNSGLRITVRHGACDVVRTPSDNGDSWELTPVAGNWGIFFHEDGNTILNLTLETESGFVEIRSIDLQAKQRNRVGKDELIKIAESMPVFGGAAVSAKP